MTTTAAASTPRRRRPMVEMTGIVSDLRVGDFVDTIGDGVLYTRMSVNSLIHRIRPGYAVTSKGVREVTVYEFVAKSVGNQSLRQDVSVKFRRFAD